MTLLSALFVLLALSGGGRGGQSPTLVLDAPGRAGDKTVEFRGEAYAPGAEVVLALGEDAIILTITHADAKGTISGVFAAPDPRVLPEMAGKAARVTAIETASGIRSKAAQLRIARPVTTDAMQTRGTAGLSLDLKVGQAPENATYWVLFGTPGAPPAARRLADPEGDGTYSLSVEVEAGKSLAIRIVQGTGTRNTSAGPAPEDPVRTLRTFSTVTPRVALMLRVDATAPR